MQQVPFFDPKLNPGLLDQLANYQRTMLVYIYIVGVLSDITREQFSVLGTSGWRKLDRNSATGVRTSLTTIPAVHRFKPLNHEGTGVSSWFNG